MPRRNRNASRPRRSNKWYYVLTAPRFDSYHYGSVLNDHLISNGGRIKAWAKQRERGDEAGVIHEQGYLILKRATTQAALGRSFVPFQDEHLRFRPCDGNVQACREYVSKEETRMAGEEPMEGMCR